jgi:hypothetical protein
MENEQRFLLKTAEAKKLIHNAPSGAVFNLHIRVDLPVCDKEDHVFPRGGAAWLKLSRTDAMYLVSTLMSDELEAKGARLPIRTYQDTRLRRNRKTCQLEDAVRHVYWIG